MTEGQYERLLANSSRVAMLLLGAVAFIVALQAGKVLLAPVCFAIVIGLMFGPVADWLEGHGVRPALSAAVVVVLFIGILSVAVILFARPLSEWVARAPELWERLRQQLMTMKGPLEALAGFQEQLQSIFGKGTAVEVQVLDGGPVQDMAFMAPSVLADVLLFFASLYFFLATREQIRVSVLSLCVSRRIRWRVAHVFRDIEAQVSRFLLSAACLNLGVGVATSIAMWVLGMPSPLLWGAMAGLLNFIPYVGQAVMLAVLFMVGLGTEPNMVGVLLPVAVYAAINLTADQVVFPLLVGKALTLNPLLILLSIAFWIWMWGPVGGFVAVPSLLVLQSVVGHILPGRSVSPRRIRRNVIRAATQDAEISAPNPPPPLPDPVPQHEPPAVAN
ncbi:MAG: AI-2E family transporter, partial [Devosia sp.]